MSSHRSPVRHAVGTVVYHPDLRLLSALVTVAMADGLPILVFVNGPQPPVVEAFLMRLEGATVLRAAVNEGLGRGLNALMEAAARAGHERVLLLDQDSGLTPGLMAALSDRLDAARAAGHRVVAIAPRLVAPKNSTYREIRLRRRRAASPMAGCVEYLPTSGSLVTVEAWRGVGPFREDFFIGGIDVEWSGRAWSAGWASVVADELTLEHRWGIERMWRGQPQILQQSQDRLFYYVRNSIFCLRLPYMSRRWKAWQLARLAAQLPLLLAFHPRMRARLVRRAVRDGWHGHLGAFDETTAPDA